MTSVTDPRITLERVNCAICGCDDNAVVLSGRDNEHDLVGTFDVAECASCGHHFTNPRPSTDSLDVLYPSDYSAFRVPDGSIFDRLRAAYTELVQFGRRQHRSTRTLLEVGCGSGGNLHRFQELGWDVRGLEPSSSAVAIARDRGLDVAVGTDLAVDDLGADSFDEVHALMVIEHVPSPVDTLQRLHRVARPGAQLVISVPNFESRSRRRFGANWFPLQVPRHFHHFDRSSIEQALCAAGWELEKIWFQPTTADFFKSVQLTARDGRFTGAARVLARVGKVLDLLLLPVLLPLAQMRGSSRMTVTGRKPAGTP